MLFIINRQACIYGLKEEEEKIFTNNNAIKQEKNKETILKLARSRLPEKQKAIYAGR